MNNWIRRSVQVGTVSAGIVLAVAATAQAHVPQAGLVAGKAGIAAPSSTPRDGNDGTGNTDPGIPKGATPGIRVRNADGSTSTRYGPVNQAQPASQPSEQSQSGAETPADTTTTNGPVSTTTTTTTTTSAPTNGAGTPNGSVDYNQPQAAVPAAAAPQPTGGVAPAAGNAPAAVPATGAAPGGAPYGGAAPYGGTAPYGGSAPFGGTAPFGGGVLPAGYLNDTWADWGDVDFVAFRSDYPLWRSCFGGGPFRWHHRWCDDFGGSGFVDRGCWCEDGPWTFNGRRFRPGFLAGLGVFA